MKLDIDNNAYDKSDEELEKSKEGDKEDKEPPTGYSPFPDIPIPEPVRWRLYLYVVFLTMSLATSISFLVWRVWNIHQTVANRHDLKSWELVGAIVRFLGEVVIIALAYIQTVYILLLFSWNKSDAKESFDFEGVTVDKNDEEKENLEDVDIIIPCCNEPLQMIKDTVSAALAIDWISLNIFVCDDGTDDQLKLWVEKLQESTLPNLPQKTQRTAKYIRRQKTVPHHAKAGNINNCFENFCISKYVAVVDADMIIHPTFLKETIKMFGQMVAYVQVPQTYYNIGWADPWASDAQKRFYYNVQHTAVHRWGASECVGTGVVFRRDHLEKVGGFTTGALTEDTATGMELHKAGFSSAYLPRVLQLGTTPPSLAGQYRQKMRWTLGGLQVFHKSSILCSTSLKGFVQKWPYFSIGVNFYSVILVYLPAVLLAFLSLITDNYFIYFTDVHEALWFYWLYIPSIIYLSLLTRLQYILFLRGGHVLFHRACTWFLFSLLMPLDAFFTNFLKPGLVRFKVTNALDTLTRNTWLNTWKKLVPFILYLTLFLGCLLSTLLSMMLEEEEEITWEDWLFLAGKFLWSSMIIQYTLPILLAVCSNREYPDHEDLVIRTFHPRWGLELPSVKKEGQLTLETPSWSNSAWLYEVIPLLFLTYLITRAALLHTGNYDVQRFNKYIIG